MAKRTASPPTEGAVTAEEAARFAAAADMVMHIPPSAHGSAKDPEAPHIGTLREKRLHAAIKAYLCPDTSCHERPVGDLLADGEPRGKPRRMVADILCDGGIMEVQTGSFFPLRDKIAWYLAHTAGHVTVVHPLPAVRYLSWIDPESGSILSRRRSPKRGRVRDVAKELYWLSDFIGNPRFSVRVLLIELEEYRMADGWSRDKKRGSSRYERFPTALYGDITLTSPADYAAYFLPDAWATTTQNDTPPLFTAADYARATGIRGKATYSTLQILASLGLVEACEQKIGRSRAYRCRADDSRTSGLPPYSS